MKKLFIFMVATLMTLSTANAQDNEKGKLKSYNFVEAQGGVQFTSTDAKIDKLLMPTAGFSIGRYFSPAVGLRLHVNGWQTKGGFDQLDQYYKFNYITTDADLLLNLTNLFSKRYNHALNLILVGGFGLTNAWNNDQLKAITAQHQDLNTQLAWDKNRLSHNIRAGLRLETNVTKPLGLSLEVTANSLSDRFNSKANTSDDWMFTAMLGLSIRFGHKYAGPTYITKLIDVVDSVWVDEPTTIMVKEKKPVVKMEQKRIEEVVFFNIRESEADAAQGIDQAIKKIADLMKTSDDANFTVTGYADKGTGNPKLNKMYALKRAQGVTDKLINEHGFDASRVKSDSKGDTVQPFEENDKNRCVIVTGEGTFKVTTYEEVEVEKQTTKKVKKQVIRQEEIKELVAD
ncbi:MAG: OmpA family protein [Prevotella sp.]|nr:OmpA family protein [Prevotella sp.]MBR7087698.1 OmpA family protein [Prevotella sp.]